RSSAVYYYHPATYELHSLSLHDALPILIAAVKADHRKLVFIDTIVKGGTQIGLENTLGGQIEGRELKKAVTPLLNDRVDEDELPDRKSTRLNSSHQIISYAVFCLKKKTT